MFVGCQRQVGCLLSWPSCGLSINYLSWADNSSIAAASNGTLRPHTLFTHSTHTHYTGCLQTRCHITIAGRRPLRCLTPTATSRHPSPPPRCVTLHARRPVPHTRRALGFGVQRFPRRLRFLVWRFKHAHRYATSATLYMCVHLDVF